HAVGPIWQGGQRGEPALLASAYRSSLAVATAHWAKTVAFPSISAGAYGYPIDQAAEIAIQTVLAEAPGLGLAEARFVLFSAADLQTYAASLERVRGRPRGDAAGPAKTPG
ncbi:MAG: macro domain-containing protein, partial [Actinobacteria bacterium]|nr:macro domain-containing protein [Actinomycetota bacterium]